MKTSIFDSKEEVRRMRLRSLVGLFQKTDRILSSRQVHCVLKPSNGASEVAPAWTEGTVITFADVEVGAVDTAEDIVRLSGLNYHELGHVMFTPDLRGATDSLANLVRSDSQKAVIFNILEDQRQESMMVALWPSVRHYLTPMFVEYIMNRKETDKAGNPIAPDHKTTFILSHGRRYLGSEVRDAIEALFVMPQIVPDLKSVIDRYRELNLDRPDDRDIAVHLINRFADLMNRLQPDDFKEGLQYQHSASYSHSSQSVSRSSNQKEQSRQAVEGVKNGDDDRDIIDSNGDGGSGSGNGDEEGEHGEGDSGQGESEAPGWRDDDKGGRGYSPGNNNRQSRTDWTHGDPDLDKALKDVLDEVMRDKDVRSDIARSQQGIKSMAMPEPIKKSATFSENTDHEPVVAARRMGRKLQQIVEQQDPGWETRQSSGRFNVRRAMDGTGIDELFDQWNEGNADASSIEAVVLLDSSSSMNGASKDLSKAAWTIKRSFDSINAPCTVYDYNDAARIIYAATDKAQPNKFPSVPTRGGTEPHQAAGEAMRRLISSKKKKRVFIVMTDGAWPGRVFGTVPDTVFMADEYIAAMNTADVLTVMAFYPSDGVSRRGHTITADRVNGHNCQLKHVVATLDDLTTLANEIVRSLIKQRR